MSSEARSNAPGAFVFIVGPSGAGKDTLLEGARAALAADVRFHFVRRSVTRSSGHWEAHASLSVEDFAAAEERGEFALTWRAHNLHYGVPSTAVDRMREGRIVVCNGSRGAIDSANRAFRDVRLVLVTASREVREARLGARGRGDDIRARLERLSAEDFTQRAELVIVNEASPAEGTRKLVRFLEDLARRPSAS